MDVKNGNWIHRLRRKSVIRTRDTDVSRPYEDNE
jgi:hypothetical protein